MVSPQKYFEESNNHDKQPKRLNFKILTDLRIKLREKYGQEYSAAMLRAIEKLIDKFFETKNYKKQMAIAVIDGTKQRFFHFSYVYAMPQMDYPVVDSLEEIDVDGFLEYFNKQLATSYDIQREKAEIYQQDTERATD